MKIGNEKNKGQELLPSILIGKMRMRKAKNEGFDEKRNCKEGGEDLKNKQEVKHIKNQRPLFNFIKNHPVGWLTVGVKK